MSSSRPALTVPISTVLFLALAGACGGQPSPGASVAAGPLLGAGAVEVISSTAQRLVLRVHVGAMTTRPVDTPAGAFIRVVPQDDLMALRHGPEWTSWPESAVRTVMVALPIGGLATVSIAREGAAQRIPGRLYPIQPPRRGAAGRLPGDPPPADPSGFVFDPARYAQGTTDASVPLSFQAMGTAGVNMWALRLHVADVDAGGEMTVHASLRVQIDFSGGTCFKAVRDAVGLGLDPVDQRIETLRSTLEQAAVNQTVLSDYACTESIDALAPGARLLVVSHPAFLTAAQDLAVHKQALGISTQVVSTADIASPLTDVALKGYLMQAHDRWAVRPRWVLLLGDADKIPTHYDQMVNLFDSARNAGDQYYGQRGDVRSAPVFGIGRFPADTLTEAQAMVNKVKAYERTPPGYLSPFYATATFAAQFQDDDLDGVEDRRYVEVSEDIRAFQQSRGVAVQRIYAADPGSDPRQWQGGGTIPTGLRRPGFAWDGAAPAILSAAGSGTSLMLHRDHGWWWGWGSPFFTTTDANRMAVTGSAFPVIFSVNCASGIFDNDTVDRPAHIVGAGYGPDPAAVYFAERLMRKGNGALAVIGDGRSSDTKLNDDLARGLFDAPFPGYLPFGGPLPQARLSDVLDHAKAYLHTRGYSPDALAQELTIYNLLGDPSLKLRTKRPSPLAITTTAQVQGLLEVPILVLAGCPGCVVEPLPFGDVLVVVIDQAGAVIGRGVAGSDGVARVPLGGRRGLFRIIASGGETRPIELPLLAL